MATSTTSASTTGGCSFDDLCRGVSSYACDNLIDVIPDQNGDITEARLVKHITDCLQSLETQTDRTVETFYIGKTHVRQRRNRRFNHMDRSTWRLDDGINNRYRDHRDKVYGRDGLVVLTVVRREAIPAAVRESLPKFDHEDYALYLERCLIQHFKRNDARLHNKSADAGGRVSSSAIGYPLYLAFKLEDQEIPNPQDNAEETET